LVCVYLQRAYNRAAAAMLLTSFTTAMSFVCNLGTAIPVIQSFMLFMSLIVLTNYVLVITVFPVVVIVWVRTIRPLEDRCWTTCCCCCSGSSSSGRNEIVHQSRGFQNGFQSRGREGSHVEMTDMARSEGVLVVTASNSEGERKQSSTNNSNGKSNVFKSNNVGSNRTQRASSFNKVVPLLPSKQSTRKKSSTNSTSSTGIAGTVWDDTPSTLASTSNSEHIHANHNVPSLSEMQTALEKMYEAHRPEKLLDISFVPNLLQHYLELHNVQYRIHNHKLFVASSQDTGEQLASVWHDLVQACNDKYKTDLSRYLTGTGTGTGTENDHVSDELMSEIEALSIFATAPSQNRSRRLDRTQQCLVSFVSCLLTSKTSARFTLLCSFCVAILGVLCAMQVREITSTICL
jgi:hypothetical protein